MVLFWIEMRWNTESFSCIGCVIIWWNIKTSHCFIVWKITERTLFPIEKLPQEDFQWSNAEMPRILCFWTFSEEVHCWFTVFAGFTSVLGYEQGSGLTPDWPIFDMTFSIQASRVFTDKYFHLPLSVLHVQRSQEVNGLKLYSFLPIHCRQTLTFTVAVFSLLWYNIGNVKPNTDAELMSSVDLSRVLQKSPAWRMQMITSFLMRTCCFFCNSEIMTYKNSNFILWECTSSAMKLIWGKVSLVQEGNWVRYVRIPAETGMSWVQHSAMTMETSMLFLGLAANSWPPASQATADSSSAGWKRNIFSLRCSYSKDFWKYLTLSLFRAEKKSYENACEIKIVFSYPGGWIASLK